MSFSRMIHVENYSSYVVIVKKKKKQITKQSVQYGFTIVCLCIEQLWKDSQYDFISNSYLWGME